MYYSATIMEMSGVGSHSEAIWLAAVTAAVNCGCTFIGLKYIDSKGALLLSEREVKKRRKTYVLYREKLGP